jgi:High potential iron-sulfur protein
MPQSPLQASADMSRRTLLKSLVLAAAAGSLASVELGAAEAPLIAEDDPEAKAVKYVEDATQAREAGGNRCDTCSLYQGRDGAAVGGCQLFKGKQVKAAGWCASWAPQM